MHFYCWLTSELVTTNRAQCDCGPPRPDAVVWATEIPAQAELGRGILESRTGLYPLLLRRFHTNLFGCDCKSARGDHIPTQIVIEEIA